MRGFLTRYRRRLQVAFAAYSIFKRVEDEAYHGDTVCIELSHVPRWGKHPEWCISDTTRFPYAK